MGEQKYPTREWIEQCKRNAELSGVGDLGGYIYLYDAILAMHDRIDNLTRARNTWREQAERLSKRVEETT